MGDIESWELLEPMLYLGRRIRPSTAGMGKHRGGSGFESVRMVHGARNQEIFNCGNGYVFFGGGLFGGYPAASHYRYHVAKTDLADRIAAGEPYPVSVRDPEHNELTPFVNGEELKDRNVKNVPETRDEYDLYISVLAGGHGLGDVLDRAVEDVVKDLDEDLLLPRFADSAYGVVASQGADGKWTVDMEATEKRRRAIREQRLQRSVSVSEWFEEQKGRVARMEFSETTRKMYRESLELSERWGTSFREFWGLAEDWQVPSA